MFDYKERRTKLYALMEAEGVDLVFLPKHSADLDYLTGTDIYATFNLSQDLIN